MLGNIIGVVGVILTIVLGYYSIILAKRTMPTTKITFKKNECFSLFSSAVRNLKIDVAYSNKKIENSLILFKGEIQNSGSTDIDKVSVYEPLLISTNASYDWLEVFLTDKATKANAVIKKLDEKKVTIEWDLLKKNEKIEFEALIETKNEKETELVDFYNSLEFNYRITNLDKIHFEQETVDSADKSRKKKKIFEIISLLLLGSFLLFTPEINEKTLRSNDFIDLHYIIISQKEGGSFSSKIISLSEDIILLERMDGRNEEVTIADFNKKYLISGIQKANTSFSTKAIKILGVITIIIGLIHLLILINRPRNPDHVLNAK